MKEIEKKTVTESILEIRHEAVGRFLDMRGYIADYIKSSNIFPHWQIEQNIVFFRDLEDRMEKMGGYIGYKSMGISVFNPDSKKYFEEKAVDFWKSVVSNGMYKIPIIQRFGCRTKAFINFNVDFEEINKKIYNISFKSEFIDLIGEKQEDLQIVVDTVINNLNVRTIIGPIKNNEAFKYFSFKTKEFEDTGIYIDIDVSRSKDIDFYNLHKLIDEAVKIIWKRIDNIEKCFEIK